MEQAANSGSAQHTPGPVATKLSESPACTRWKVQWPSTVTKQGKAYSVTTYPSSSLMSIETFVKRRRVAQGVATKITPAIRAAIAKATGSEA